MERRRDRLEPAARELREQFRSYNAVLVIHNLAFGANHRTETLGNLSDSGQATFTWEAKFEYLMGLAAAGPLADPPPDGDTVEGVKELLATVFDGAYAALFLETVPDGRLSDEVETARFLFRAEDLLDRMTGFPAHLERIDAAVFDPHRDFYVSNLGFNPADMIRMVRRRVHDLNKRAQALYTGLRELSSGGASDKEMGPYMEALHRVGLAGRFWMPEHLARDTAIDETEIRAMLRSFSIEFESQPEFLLPTDPNAIRTRPLLRLPEDDLFFIASGWAFPRALHDWIIDLQQTDKQNVVDRYRKHRSDATQQLVAGIAKSIFGADQVQEQLHFDTRDLGHGEVDVLVTGDWPLAIEAKSQAVTRPARRGAPDRIRRHSDDIIGTGLSQTYKARAYILAEHGREFAAKEGGPTVCRLDDDITDVTEILVTFDRMDPLAATGSGLVRDGARVAWIVCLPDLMTIIDLLPHAALFHRYAVRRASSLRDGLLAYVETDLLGEFLDDRMASLLARVRTERQVHVPHHSGPANTFFSLGEYVPLPPPDLGVPNEVLERLDTTFGDPGWSRVAHAAADATPRTWRAWTRFTKKHTNSRAFTFPGTDVGLSLGSRS